MEQEVDPTYAERMNRTLEIMEGKIPQRAGSRAQPRSKKVVDGKDGRRGPAFQTGKRLRHALPPAF